MPPVLITVKDAENLTQAHNCRSGDEISFAKNLRRKAILFVDLHIQNVLVHLIDKY